MTAEADTWLKQTMNESEEADPVFDDPLPSTESVPDRGGSRRSRKALALLAGFFLVFGAGAAVGAFVFNQSGSGTVGAPPAQGPTTFSIGTIQPCNSNCNGTLINGAMGSPSGFTYAILFSVTAINAQVTDTDTNFQSLYLVPTTVTSCSSTIGGNWVQVPVTHSAITIAAQAYNYCLYYSSWTAGSSVSFGVSYST